MERIIALSGGIRGGGLMSCGGTWGEYRLSSKKGILDWIRLNEDHIDRKGT